MAQRYSRLPQENTAPEPGIARAAIFPFASDEAVIRAVLLLVITFVAFSPCITSNDYAKKMGFSGFIWDDDQLLTVNPAIRQGGRTFNAEAWAGLKKFWVPEDDARISADYFPLTSTTLWLEWRLWGNDEPHAPPEDQGIGAPGYHTTNILLHAICVVLLWRVLLALKIPGAWVAALLWGIHPVCVESVCWISERKNTLSMCFMLMTFGAWLKWFNRGEEGGYWRSALWFLLALLSKTSVVPVPIMLLVITWWKHGRITSRDVQRSAIFFVMAFTLGLVTVYFQHGRAVGDEYIPIGGVFREQSEQMIAAAKEAGQSTLPGVALNYAGRALGASFALGFYTYKCLVPINLIVIYPQWHEELAWYLQAIPGVLVIGLFFACWIYRSTWGRHVLLGYGFFVLFLLPVLGMLKMSYMRLTLVADHFQYFSMPGLIALVVAGAIWLFDRMDRSTAVVFQWGVGVPVTAVLWVMTYQFSFVYKDRLALWKDTLKKNDNTWQAHNHMGAILFSQRQFQQAEYHFRRGVELKPYNCEVHNNLGLALATRGDMEGAIAHYKKAVAIKGDDASIRANLANALQQMGRLEEALPHYMEAVRLNPSNPGLLVNYGVVLFSLNRTAEALEQFEAALKIAPGMREALKNAEVARRKLAAQEVSKGTGTEGN